MSAVLAISRPLVISNRIKFNTIQIMSYYFVIISPTDSPLFELTFGTSKAGGDGVARFRNGETSRYMNQFIVHASLDVVEEVQWLNNNM